MREYDISRSEKYNVLLKSLKELALAVCDVYMTLKDIELEVKYQEHRIERGSWNEEDGSDEYHH